MFRHLIPRLADRYRVIAPDHVGFGRSATPPATEFRYTFDALTEITRGLLDQLGVERFAMYVQDYGAPIGWRLALARPSAVTAVISQNGNAYDVLLRAGRRPARVDHHRRPRLPRALRAPAEEPGLTA